MKFEGTLNPKNKMEKRKKEREKGCGAHRNGSEGLVGPVVRMGKGGFWNLPDKAGRGMFM